MFCSLSAPPQFPSGQFLLLWPSVFAAVLVAFAIERAWTRRGVPPTPLRLLASYLLLTPALGFGILWVVPLLAGTSNKFATATMLANLSYGGAIAVLSAGYAWRCLRVGRAHAQRSPADAERFLAHGRLAASGVAGLCAAGLTSFSFAALA